VGVARQYCGVLGKQDNCQVAVSISLANEQASLPVAYRLYLPQEWAQDLARRAKAQVPQDVGFATKAQLALQQLEGLLAQGAPRHCVLADAGYGVDSAFRRRLGRGRPPVVPRRTRTRQALSVKALALSLPSSAFHTISWREGSNATLSGRFAALRVRNAGGNAGRARLQPEQWLLIEWPAQDAEPLKYYLSNLPAESALNDLVAAAHMRWRIERDYQELKQEIGLGHYEGRGWRGFHHHASLSIAAYGFLVAERLAAGQTAAVKKNPIVGQIPALPADYIPRGSPARTATRARLDRHHPPAAKR